MKKTTIQDTIFIFNVAIKKSSPLLCRIWDQKNRWKVSGKQIVSIFKGATYITYPAREFIYAPSYPYRKLTKILTSRATFSIRN